MAGSGAEVEGSGTVVGTPVVGIAVDGTAVEGAPVRIIVTTSDTHRGVQYGPNPLPFKHRHTRHDESGTE